MGHSLSHDVFRLVGEAIPCVTYAGATDIEYRWLYNPVPDLTQVSKSIEISIRSAFFGSDFSCFVISVTVGAISKKDEDLRLKIEMWRKYFTETGARNPESKFKNLLASQFERAKLALAPASELLVQVSISPVQT